MSDKTLKQQIADLNKMAEDGEDKLNNYLDHRSDLSDVERAKGDRQYMDFVMHMRVHRQLLQHARKPIH